jgi:nitroreductase
MQNLCLRAHDLGLGTVIVGSIDHENLKKQVSLPDGFEAVVVIPVGKPVDPDKQGPPRKNIPDFVSLDVYGNRYNQ